MEPFIFEHLDEQVDEYPIKIFFSNKGNFACLKVTIKRNMDNTKLIPNKQNSNKKLYDFQGENSKNDIFLI